MKSGKIEKSKRNLEGQKKIAKEGKMRRADYLLIGFVIGALTVGFLCFAILQFYGGLAVG